MCAAFCTSVMTGEPTPQMTSMATSKTRVMDMQSLWNDDPEEVLLDLGFGRDEPDLSGRIPARFINYPSLAKGINLRVFLEAQKTRIDLENPDVSNRFRQLEVLHEVTSALNCLVGSSASNGKLTKNHLLPEAQEKRRRISQLFRRLSKKSLSQIKSLTLQEPHSPIPSSPSSIPFVELQPSHSTKVNELSSKRSKPEPLEIMQLLPLTEEKEVGLEQQGQNYSIFPVQEQTTGSAHGTDVKPFIGKRFPLPKRFLGQTAESFEMEEITSFDEGSVIETGHGGAETAECLSYIGTARNVGVRSLIRTWSCQSDSSGFLEEPLIPSNPPPVPQGSSLIKARCGLPGWDAESQTNELPEVLSSRNSNVSTGFILSHSESNSPLDPCNTQSELTETSPYETLCSDHRVDPPLVDSPASPHLQNQSNTLDSPFLYKSNSNNLQEHSKKGSYLDSKEPFHLDEENLLIQSSIFKSNDLEKVHQPSSNSKTNYSDDLTDEAVEETSKPDQQKCVPKTEENTCSLSPLQSFISKFNDLEKDHQTFSNVQTHYSNDLMDTAVEGTSKPDQQKYVPKTEESTSSLSPLKYFISKSNNLEKAHQPASNLETNYSDDLMDAAVEENSHFPEHQNNHEAVLFQKGIQGSPHQYPKHNLYLDTLPNEKHDTQCERCTEDVQTPENDVALNKWCPRISNKECNQKGKSLQTSASIETSASTERDEYVFQIENIAEVYENYSILHNQISEVHNILAVKPRDLVEIESLDMVFETSVDCSDSDNDDLRGFFQQLDTEARVYWAEPVQVSSQTPEPEESVPPQQSEVDLPPGETAAYNTFPYYSQTLPLNVSHSTMRNHAPDITKETFRPLEVPDAKQSCPSVSVQMSSCLPSHIVHRKDVPYTTGLTKTPSISVVPLDTSSPFKAVQSWSDLQIQRNILSKKSSGSSLNKVSGTTNNDWQLQESISELAKIRETVPVGTGLWPEGMEEIDMNEKNRLIDFQFNPYSKAACCCFCDYQCVCCTENSDRGTNLTKCPVSQEELEEMILCLQQFCSVLKKMEEQLSEEQAAVYSDLSDDDRQRVRHIEELRLAVKLEADELEMQLNNLAYHHDKILKMKMHRLLDEQSMLCSQLKLFSPGASFYSLSHNPNRTVATQCNLSDTWKPDSPKESPSGWEVACEYHGGCPPKKDKLDLVSLLQRVKTSCIQ